MPEAPTYEQLLALVGGLSERVAEQDRVIARQADRIAELERRLGTDSSNSSRPPSADAPWDTARAKKRSSRTRSGRNPGKQPGAASSSRSLVDDPDPVVVISPPRCGGCARSLAEAAESGRERRQVVDVAPAPAPEITEYQRVSKSCSCCGRVSTPGWDETGDERAEVVATPGSPVRIGPHALARAALVTCGHSLPVGRSRALLVALTGIDVSTGFLAGVRGRAARKLERTFLPYLRGLLSGAPVLHADETTTPRRRCAVLRARRLHPVPDPDARRRPQQRRHRCRRCAARFTGILIRDGYSGYAHLPGVHAWCGAHLLRDLRSLSDADPDGQLWALAMADTLLEAHHGATQARARGADALDAPVLARIRNHYHGALARGRADNQGQPGTLAAQARTLIARFTRFEDMILRFATDLVPFTNNEAERAVRPVKVQQRTSGGAWRTLQGLIDFAIVQSYLDTATKWGIDKLHALHQLFTTGPWLPPALHPS